MKWFKSWRADWQDCLYLHVYSPVEVDGLPTPGPLPVMVWFTGGAFLVGGGSWYSFEKQFAIGH